MLNAGDRAPKFSLTSDEGATVSLDALRGNTVVLYFYPKDDTPGCTREAQAFSESLDEFERAGAVVLGVSRDSVERHCKFRDKYDLKVKLLSDPDGAVHQAYGAYGEKVMYGKKVMGTIRSTFIIGPGGVVKRAYYGVKVDGHADDVLASVRGDRVEPAPGAKPVKAAAGAAKPVKAAAKAAKPVKEAAKAAKPVKAAAGAAKPVKAAAGAAKPVKAAAKAAKPVKTAAKAAKPVKTAAKAAKPVKAAAKPVKAPAKPVKVAAKAAKPVAKLPSKA